MNTSVSLIREDLKDFQPYSSARSEAGFAEILLNANERAWPNPLYPGLNRYPEQQPKNVLKRLSSFYQVGINQCLISRGSDEAIELLIRLFCMPGKESIMICPPTFGMYSVSATLQAVQCLEIPLLENTNFDIDVEGIINAWNPSVKILFLCSPNNPTGNLIDSKKILRLCKQFKNKCIVVVDEAYIEYSNAKSASRYINLYDNLVILRTLSKAFGLAAARCGATLANNSIIKNLQKVMAPYPIPTMLVDIIENNMSDKMLANFQSSLQETRLLRENLCKALEPFPFIQSIRSTEANFILIQVKESDALLRFCQKHNILLRDMSKKRGLKNTVRISIGKQDELNHLLNCLRLYNEN